MLTWMFVSVALAADPVASSAADPAAGGVLYAASCTACHGAKGDGKGPAAIALKPKPTDLTSSAWWVGKTDEQLIVAIRAGRPGTSMAPFTELSDAEVLNLVAYLRTFAVK